MKNHWTMKALALVLAALSGIAMIVGAMGIILSEEVGYVESRLWGYSDDASVHDFCQNAAQYVAGCYAQQQTGMSEEFFREYIYWEYPQAESLEFGFSYRVMDDRGVTLENTRGYGRDYAYEYSTWIYIVDSVCVAMPLMDYYPEYDEYLDMTRESGSYTDSTGVVFPSLTKGTYAYAYGRQDGTLYRIDYVNTSQFQVEICLTDVQYGMILASDEAQRPECLVAEQMRGCGLAVYVQALLAGLVSLVLSACWLCSMAGRSPESDEVRPGGLNRLPLDVYAAVALCVGAVVLLAGPALLAQEAVYLTQNFSLWRFLLLADGAAAGILPAMLAMAVAAQWKLGDCVWRNMLSGRVVGWLAVRGRGMLNWLSQKGAVLGNLLRRGCELLPTTWKWVLSIGGAGIVVLLTAYFAFGRYSYLRWNWFFGFLLLAEVIAVVGVIAWCVYALGVLKQGAGQMARGDLNHRVPEACLWGPFREFAVELNSLSGVVRTAAREQLKSERMKTELITNVSHDIKTPLTSIINYVDLLQKTDDPVQRASYLEVLERQSMQLKKLIADLMEMSKASSGNLAMELTATDVTETVHQALGEFADRLQSRGLQVVLRSPDEAVALCDGRLLWRVLSNLLSNVVKYALSGTRVYLDVTGSEDRVCICLKNISAEPLNVCADELMERFVRGDASRSTEGSGLGLNIARSLMEAMGGELEPVVDGDLFKVNLTLEKCS